MTKADFKVEIDWNNDGDWSDTGEDVTNRVLNNPGIVCARGRDQIRALAPPMAGSCDLSLNNASKDYSPDYASGPLYGNLVPGRALRIRTTAPGTNDLWRGHLDDLAQEPFVGGGGRVRIPALGKLAKLKGVKVSTALHQNVTTAGALTTLFAAAGLAESEYSMLDTGKTVLTAWWCNDDDAFAMMARLLAAEGPGAAIYEQANGQIRFHSRHYRLLTARSTTSQATFGDGATEPKHSPPLGFEPNLKGVVNSATIVTATLTLAGSATNLKTITLDPPVTLTSLQSVVIPVQLDAPANWEDAPGSGNIILPTLTFVDGFGVFSATGNRVSGQSFLLTITSADAAPFTIATVTVRGYTSTTATTPIANSVSTAASQAKYGVRSLPTSYNPWPYISQAVARDFCDAIVQAYQEPRATVNVTVHNANSTRLAQQLAREISDRVTVVEAQTGLNAAVFVEQIRHEVREGGRFHRTIFGCEKAGSINYGIWGTSVWGTGTWGF